MPTNIIMPQMGESVAEGTVVKWLKKVGERVERDEPLFEISTDKVDAEIPSPAAGVLTKILVKENETVEVNTVVAEIDGESASVAAPEEKPKSPAPKRAPAAPGAAATATAVPPPAPATASRREGEKIRSSPLVRRIAREHQVDLARVPGTGLGGRVSKKDIMAYVGQSPAETSGEPSSPATGGGKPAAARRTAAPPMVFTGPTEVVAMTPMRR